MKKRELMLSAIALMCFIPFIGLSTVEADCSPEVLEQYRKELADTTLTYEYVSSETITIHEEKQDISNKIKVKVENLPDYYYVALSYGNVLFPTFTEGYPLYIDSGVYRVNIYNVFCDNQAAKSFEVFIPSYNKDLDDKWFDGTYEQNKKKERKENKQKINILLIIGVSSLLIILIVLIVFLLNRKKSFE